MKTDTYHSPDLHGKRNRDIPKDFLSYATKDPYGFFARIKQQYPQLSAYSNREIAGCITEYNKQLAADVVSSRDGVVLPEGLGAIVTGICKPTEKTSSYNINYAASKRAGTTVTFRNTHTNGYLARIYYTNDFPRCRFTNHQQWSFKPARALSRAVSAIMKDGAAYNRYIVFSKRHPVYDLFDKSIKARAAKRKVKAMEATAKRWAEYDEFSFD